MLLALFETFCKDLGNLMRKLLGHFCTVIAVVASAGTVSTVSAHEGHGTSSLVDVHSATHYVTEPLHVGQLCVAAAALVCILVIALHGRQSRKSVVR